MEYFTFRMKDGSSYIHVQLLPKQPLVLHESTKILTPCITI